MNEQESRREALADMIRMAEEAGLYEAEAELYETIDVGEVDWNKTAIQNMELNRQKTEAINRIRELAKKYEKFGNDLDPRFAPSAVFQGVAKEIIKALDGEE